MTTKKIVKEIKNKNIISKNDLNFIEEIKKKAINYGIDYLKNKVEISKTDISKYLEKFIEKKINKELKNFKKQIKKYIIKIIITTILIIATLFFFYSIIQIIIINLKMPAFLTNLLYCFFLIMISFIIFITN